MKIGRNKQGVLYWTDYIDGKRIKRESKFWKTQKEAREHYNEFVESLEIDPSQKVTLTYQELVSEYIEHLSLSKKESTTLGQKNMLENVIGPYFKNKKVNKINAKDVQRFQKIILKKTYNHKGVKKSLSNAYIYKLQISLKNMLDYAFRFRYINQNPFDLVPIVKRHIYEPKKKMTILTKAQFDDFLETIDNQIYRTLFSVLYWCGLRIGELMALSINDYDKNNKTLHVYKTYDSKNNVITTNKTDSERFVSIPNACSIELEKLLEMYEKESDGILHQDNPIFSYGGIIPKTTLDRYKNKFIKEANELHNKKVPYFTFHELRHTHVSTLIDLGMEPKDISERLGHSVEMVNNTYAHLFPERKDLLLDKLNDFSENG